MTENKPLAELPVEELIKIIEQKDKELTDTKAELDLTVTVNTRLTAEIEKLEAGGRKQEAEKKSTGKAGVSERTFLIDEVKYEFVFASMSTKDGVITADEVLASPELQKRLKATGSGMIRPVKK